MRCLAFDHAWNGGFICFFDNKLPEIDLCDRIAKSQAIFSRLVFFDDSFVLQALDSKYAYPGRIDVCLVGCATDKLLSELSILKKQIKIRNIIIPYSDVYRITTHLDICIGPEIWDTLDGLNELADPEPSSVADVVSSMPVIENTINEIMSFHPANDLEKILLLDIWFQQHIQFATGRKTKAPDGYYNCPSFTRDTQFSDFLESHIGCCRHFSLFASLILNHPRMQVQCKSVRSTVIGHEWNIVTYNGLEYYVDYSHGVSRNENRVDGALKATAYTDKYTLLGLEDAIQEYPYSKEYDTGTISQTSFDRSRIQAALSELEKKGAQLSWDASLSVPSDREPLSNS